MIASTLSLLLSSGVAGRAGGLSFDGANDYVTFGANTNLQLRQFTLEAWFKWNGGGVVSSSGSGGVSAYPLVCKGRGEGEGATYNCNYFFGLGTDGVLVADFEEGPGGGTLGLNHPVFGSAAVIPGEWRHAAVSYDGATWRLYLDGVLDASSDVGLPPAFDSMQHASLGSALRTTGEPEGAFSGVLDEVRIWNYARSASEISGSMYSQIPSASGLVARWGLDETSGAEAGDSAGRGVTGTLVNGSVWTDGYPFPAGPSVQWTAYNDHLSGAGTAANVTTYSVADTGSGTGGPLVDFATGQAISPGKPGVAITATGSVTGYDGTSLGPTNASSPASLIFEGKVDWTYSAIYFGAPPDAGASEVRFAFTNLTAGRKYRFRGVGSRGGGYATRWTLATLANVTSATPAHEAGAGSPGIVTNGWAPYGDTMQPLLQAAWNSGENRCGDVIGWDDIVPAGTSFSVICSNWTQATPSGDGNATYCYAFNAFRLEEAAEIGSSVALLTPADNALFFLPTNIAISASASSASGITNVQFFVNGQPIGQKALPPYSMVWSNPAAGSYELTAEARDSEGVATVSLPVHITLASNDVPMVALTAPADGFRASAPANLILSATASDLAGVALVEFFQNGSKLGEDSASPYSMAWNSVAAGSYSLRAVASDIFGLRSTSTVAQITITNNNAPVVTLTSPTNNAVFEGPANVTLTATATDDYGVARVEFFRGTVKLGEDLSAPYALNWDSVSGGSYVLSAVATDTGGRMATSAPVNILVTGRTAGTNVLIAMGSTWKYLDNGVDQGTDWVGPGFDDSSWPEGVAQLGYGDQDEITPLNYGPDPANVYPTYYFRHAFVPDNAGTYDQLNLRLLRDDGGVVYLNGQEIYRSPSMPPGTVLYGTYATTGPDNYVDVVVGLANTLVEGTNVLAVEIHQASAGSTDVSFDLELAGVVNNTPPIVSIASPTNNATFVAPTNITVTASAADADGSVALVEFFLDGSKLGEKAFAPYSLVWSDVIVGGAYALRTVATDNLGARATSAVVTVNIQGNLRPVVSLTNPPNNSVYFLPEGESTNLLISARASDSDGTVSKVEFFADGSKVGEDTTSPYALNWLVASAATYQLTAVVTDNAGLMATSATVRVTYLSALPNGTLVSTGAVWRYYDTVTSEMPGWNTLGYDDSTWLSGPAELGYGDASQGRPEATLVGYGPNSSRKYMSTYFRTSFYLPQASIYKSLMGSLLRDDGAVVYLNGVEIFRSNMPQGPVTINTAASNAGDDGTLYFGFAGVGGGVLVDGLNVVAVEVHQDSASSTDISFDFELVGLTTNAPPMVTIASPSDNTVLSGPATFLISASVSDGDGSVTNVAFYANGTKLADVAAVPFSYNWQQAPLGTYELRAVATDNWGDKATSAPVNVFIMVPSPPTVSAFAPAPGTVTNLSQIAVSFSEPVSGVDAADLLINGVAAATVSGSGTNYTFTFPQPLEGLVSVSWAAGHGIRDGEIPPQAFDGSTAGATASYTLVDVTAPVVALIMPTPGSSVPALSRIEVTFSEPVGGVGAGDLLINGAPAARVSGSQAGPYVFEFSQPAAGNVLVSWAAAHGIRDFAASGNALVGAGWGYRLEGSAAQTGVVINELMYHPASELPAEEYIEIYNTGPAAVNLTGWRITGGIGFTFPSASLAAGAYLVVAADTAAFQAKYPGVTNVIGGWAGRLSNREDEVRLRDALGTVVDTVHYATEGDWAIRQRGPNDYNSRGWEWFAAHDGNVINTATGANEGNRSLELRNPALPRDNGQNWAPSVGANGTPGRGNSTATNNVAPLIYEVTHAPAVPTSSDSVTVSARIVDEQANGLTAQLFYRDASSSSPPNFAATAMFDDGLHGDGLAGDGVHAVQLPAQANQTVIEFYVSAADAGGRTRTWPAAARLETGEFVQRANAQYQVDDEAYAGGMPIYRLVLTEAERVEFAGINRSSDAEMNTTLVTSDGVGVKIRYLCGLRIRGAGTRSRPTPNVRVNIPADRLWNGLTEINLNSQYVHAQLAGSIVSLKSGLACAAARPVQLRINGANRAPSGTPPQGNGDGAGFGTVLCMEPIGGEWAATHFPDDPNGNVYRGSIYPWTANLSYQGANPATYPGRGYSKTSNQSDNDWTDLINLTYALNDTNSPSYVQGVERNANVESFMRYFAVSVAVDYSETSLSLGVGDDYAMYRGVNDRRFRLVPHDFDTDFGEGDTGGDPNRTIWRMLNPPTSDVSQRANWLFPFMRHPAFAPLYYRELKRLIDTTYHPSQMNLLLDQNLGGWVPNDIITRMKNFVAARNTYIRSQIPTNITVVHGLGTQGGYLYTTSPTVVLRGRANAIDTRTVLVAGQPAVWSAFDAAWTNTVALTPGINRVTVQAVNGDNAVFEQTSLEIWHDDSSTADVGGALTSSETWTAAAGPYRVTTSLTIETGATLTIEPGTTVYLSSGASLNVENGGRLLAEGRETARITFCRALGTSANWGGINISGAAGSPETRIAYAFIEGNGSAAIDSDGGTVFLDHVTFGNPGAPYLVLGSSSFVVQDCVFPATAASLAPVQGAGGIKAGGRGLFLRNFFGPTTGNNDTVVFAGGQRPGSIVQFIDNVFMGSGDDLLDLDNADAWVEGNIFLHAHKNGSPDASSAISAGTGAGASSDVTVIGNIVYDCDHGALAKQGAFLTLLNNTVVRQTHTSGLDSTGAVLCLADPNTAEGAGSYLEGNVIWEAEALVRNRTNALVTFTNNLMPLGWSGPGGNNSTNDPLFQYLPSLAETTNFTTWAQAQVMKQWFSLRPGSPAAGTGPNGRDKGALVPMGASLSGAPVGMTSQSNVTLVVGVNRTGSGITAGRWPAGAGYTHYRWRLDGGTWSAETPISTPIALSALSAGAHRVEVVARRDCGFYQDDAVYGADATVTSSQTWIVNPSAPAVRLNEILARNDSAVAVGGRYPDLIELYNSGPAAVNLGGMGLTDNADEPFKFVVPVGTMLGAGQHLVLYADNEATPPGLHLGFTLKQEGDDVSLFSAAGQLVDRVVFGPQLPDLSIGRMADGGWALATPTFGGPNQAAAVGNPLTLKLNEWLPASGTPIADDFIELFNPDPAPVHLGGLYLSDAPESGQNLAPVPALSFMAGGGYFVFTADGNADAGPAHLGFQLAGEQGLIGLYASDLSLIDCIHYGPQTNNVSQGRSPNGSSNVVFFATPTPGAPNFAPTPPLGSQLVISEVMAKNTSGVTNLDGSTPEWIELHNPTGSAISLTDLSLSDNLALPRKYVFPAGMTLPSGGYLTLFCDGALPASTNNTGFGIKANGGLVALFDTLGNGSVLLDVISYGVQAADFSISRFPVLSTNWMLTLPTPGGTGIPATMGNPAGLRLNEWMADNTQGPDWFEIFNPGLQPVDISGLYLTDDLSTPASRRKFRIPPLSFMGTGLYGYERYIADSDTTAGADHVNFSLRAGGESLGIYTAADTALDALSFGAQSANVSEGRLPDGAATIVRFALTPTPGDANYLPLTSVVINEILSATPTNGPLEDAIELRNVSTNAINLFGWYLSDGVRGLKKYRITNNVAIPPGGFAVFYEYQFNPNPDEATSFALDGSKGDQVYLSTADTAGNLTGYRAAVEFGGADPGVSFGRVVNSAGDADHVPMTARTFGADAPADVSDFRQGKGRTNAAPVVGPIVFSEIMYHPADIDGYIDNVRDEFIELRNIASESVALYDTLRPTNTWRLRGGADFNFPSGVGLAPGQNLLVVSFDPVLDTNSLAAFRAAYPGLPADARLYGPYSGKLDNGGERLELRKPGAPVGTDVPYVLVERIYYGDVAPWDAGADGTGLSLQRLNASAYGNEPTNWVAAVPAPGQGNGSADADHDGMADDWELANGLNPSDPMDAYMDPDGDGMISLHEFQAGTLPQNPGSVLRLDAVDGNSSVSDTQVALFFQGAAGRTYTVDYSDTLPASWTRLVDIGPIASPGTVWVTNQLPAAVEGRFYRIVTPRRP